MKRPRLSKPNNFTDTELQSIANALWDASDRRAEELGTRDDNQCREWDDLFYWIAEYLERKRGAK
jgi:hypothetical protein